ncbi:MAG: hypothetical protein ACXQT2_02680 [Methanotrichaceae archaeon]
MPTAEVQVLLSAGELPTWTLGFHVKIKQPDGTTEPASGYWVHLYDVDERLGLPYPGGFDGWAQCDDRGIAVFTNIGGAWYENWGLYWIWYENRYRVEIVTPDKSQVVKSFDLRLDHQWRCWDRGVKTAPGQVPEIAEGDRDWDPKEVDP